MKLQFHALVPKNVILLGEIVGSLMLLNYYFSAYNNSNITRIVYLEGRGQETLKKHMSLGDLRFLT